MGLDLTLVNNVQFYFVFLFLLFTGLNAKGLGVGFIATLAVFYATEQAQFEIIIIGWVLGYALSVFRN